MLAQQELTAIILAGGKSFRMKQDKGLVLFRGKALVEHCIDHAREITPHILLITANPAYQKFGYPCMEDEMTGKGPLGGIYTGLTHSSTTKNLVMGCDMPFLSATLLTELINKCERTDVLLAMHNGKAEPLCAVYDKRCIPHFKSFLEMGQLKITDALKGLATTEISFDNESWFIGNEFANFNFPEDLHTFEQQ